MHYCVLHLIQCTVYRRFLHTTSAVARCHQNVLYHNTLQCSLQCDSEVVARADHLVIRLQEWDMSTSLRTHICVHFRVRKLLHSTKHTFGLWVWAATWGHILNRNIKWTFKGNHTGTLQSERLILWIVWLYICISAHNKTFIHLHLTSHMLTNKGAPPWSVATVVNWMRNMSE